MGDREVHGRDVPICAILGCFHPGWYRVPAVEGRYCGDHAEDWERRGLTVEYVGPVP